MADEFVPTTEEVRAAYVTHLGRLGVPSVPAAEMFNAWLEQHDSVAVDLAAALNRHGGPDHG